MSSETIFFYLQNNLRTGQPRSSLTGALPEQGIGLGARPEPWCNSWLWKRPSCSSAWSVHTSTLIAFSCRLLMPTSRHSFRASESSARQVSSCRKNKLLRCVWIGSLGVWGQKFSGREYYLERSPIRTQNLRYKLLLMTRRKQGIWRTTAYSPTGHSLELCCWSDLGSPHILAWERKKIKSTWLLFSPFTFNQALLAGRDKASRSA